MINAMDSIYSTVFSFILMSAIISVNSFSINDVQKMKIPNIKEIIRLTNGNSKMSQSSVPYRDVKTYWKNIESTNKVKSSKLGGTFKWNVCKGNGNASLLNLKDLSISPDPLQFPGNIYFQFTGVIEKTLDAPLMVNLTLKKEIYSTWLTIPCIDGVGSCNYDDLCEILQGATCPDPLVKYNIPCKCPFEKGTYNLQKSGIYVNVKEIPSGNYYLKANIAYKGQPVICLEIHFAISSA